MRTKPDTKAIVGFKPCPKCGGSGEILCDGMELFRQQHKAWAMQFHMKPVVYNWLGEAAIPGIAVALLLPGGWYGVKVYVAVTEIPTSGIYGVYGLDRRGVPYCLKSIQGVGLWSYDDINGKAFWHLFCRQSRRDELVLLDYWPEFFELEDRKLLEAKCKGD